MNTYPLNPISQKPMTREEHHRSLNLLMITVAAAIIIGMLYWWMDSGTLQISNPPYDSQTQLRAEVAAILRDSNASADPKVVEQVASRLAQSEQTVTDSQRQSVANQLR